MNETGSFIHFLKKLNERLTFFFEIYMPNGQPPPEPDRDLIEVLFRMYYDGRVEWLSKEPLEQGNIIQTDLFKALEKTDEVTDKHPKVQNLIKDK